jgi:sugar lactone lactonase YvrE
MLHSFRFHPVVLSFVCLLLSVGVVAQTPVALPYTMTTLAGTSPMTATSGTQCPNLATGVKSTDAFGDGCLAVNAIFGAAARGGVQVDSFGNVFVSDDINKVVHVINPATGIMTVLAGLGTTCSGKVDSQGDGCLAATQTTLNGSRGMGIDPYGNVILAGYSDNAIHVICRVASPLCGSGTPTASNPILIPVGNMGLAAGCAAATGSAPTGGSGLDNTPAFSTKTNTLAAFTNNGTCSTSLGEVTQPRGATADQYGNVYYADTTTYRIRVVVGPLTSTYFSGNNPVYAALGVHYASVTTGYVYTVVDLGGTSAPATTAPTVKGNTCSETTNSVLYSGTALDTFGDGCPFDFSSLSSSSSSNVQGVAMDAAGNLIFTDPGRGLRVLYVSASGTAGAAMRNAIIANNAGVTPQTGFVYMLAGGGTTGGVSTTPNLGNSRTALDTSIFKVTVSPQGNIYVGDSTRVLFFDINTGYIRILFTQSSNVTAGSSCTAPSGQKSLSAYSDACAATSSLFGNTNGLGSAVDGQGNLYLFDSASNAAGMLVRKVLAQGMAQQILHTALIQSFQTHLLGASSATSTVTNSTNADITYGSPSCARNGDSSVDCTVTVTATPSAVDGRSASMTVANASSGEQLTVALGGTVSGSVLAFDNASTTTNSTTTPVAPTTHAIFSSIAPSAVALDGAANVYAANGTSIIESIGGTAYTLSPSLPMTPSQIAVDQAGNVFAVANGTSAIQVLAVTAAGTPSTYALTSIAYTPCSACTAAPQAIARDAAGNLYVADDQSGGSAIYRLSLVGTTLQQQTTVATGLGNPVSLAVDASGNVWVADKSAGIVYEFTPSIVNGLYTYTQSTKLSSVTPVGVAVDAAGDVYVQDLRSATVIEIPVSGSNATVLTGLQSPTGVAVDGAGNVYSADSNNHNITQVVRTAGSYGSTSTNVTSIAGTLTNIGNLAATGITQSGNSVDFTLTPTGCTIGTGNSIAAGQACAISATLSSAGLQNSGASYSETLSFLASPTTIGSVTFSDVTPAGPTATTISGPSSALFAASGTEISFTVTVTGIASPSGSQVSVSVSSVTSSGSTVVYTATPTLDSSGQSVVSLSGLAAGSYTISASYAGVANTYSPSSAQASFSINQYVATGDSRTVSEPAFPAVCTTLSAALTTVNDDLPTSVDASVSNPDGARIQAALNTCSGAGQAVELSMDGSGHNAFLTGPLSMPSNVTLLVDPGVVLFFSRNVQDYDKVAGTHTCGTVNSSSATSSCKPLIEITNGTTNVGIMGYGKIDGRGGDTLINAIAPYQGQSWWGLSSIANGGGNQQNPRFIQMDSGSSNITLYKITLRNSPLFHVSTTGAVSGFTAWDMKIITPTSSRNTDGIDPGNATNFTITRSWISDGDDNVAVGGSGTTSPASNISVTNNHFFAGHGESIGSYTSAGISNVLFDGNMLSGNGTAGKGASVNNTADSNSTGIRIKSGYDRGGVVSNIQYSNSCFQYHKAEVVFNPNYENTTGTSSPNFKNILMQNLTFLTEGTVQLTGTNNNGTIFPLQVALDNVGFTTLQTSDFGSTTAPTNAQLTYGPGAVSTNFINGYATFVGSNGNTVTNNITQSSVVPPTCNFTYIAPELTGPTGQPQTITAGDNATAVVILTPAVAGSAYPTGTVTLTDALTNNTTTATLTGTGDTTFVPLTGLSAGTHSFTMSYSGDSNYVPSVQGSPYTTAGPYVITVNAGSLSSTSTALSGVPSSTPYGTSFTATATISGSNPTGTVEFVVNGSVYAVASVSSASASTTLTLAYSTSPYSIYAVYSGDSVNAGSVSSTSSVTITTASTSTGLSANPTTTTLGHPVLLTAAVTSSAGTPTGTVTFAYTTPSNSTPTAIGSASSLSNGTAVASANLPQGTNYVTATYSGSAGFGGSASTPATVTINLPTIVPLPTSPIALPYTISTIAGGSTVTNANTTCSGSSDSFGDGCQGTAIAFTAGDDMRAVAADPFGNVYATDKSAKLVRRIAPNGVISNFAGRVSGTACVPTASTGCTPTLVSLNGPRGISSDAFGNIYLADYNGNNVYKVSVTTGLLYLVAGNGIAGTTTNGAVATATSVNTPRGVWADTVGNIYIANTGSNQILVVDSTGYIHIFAGTGTAGSSGDSGPALSATISNPQGVLTDANLNVYIADSSSGRVRVVCMTCGTGSPLDTLLATLGITSPVNGDIYTIAGNGSNGTYGGTLPTQATNVPMTPQKLAFDNGGNLYISDSNNAIWLVDFRTDLIRAIARSGSVCSGATDSVGDGCPATQAVFGSGGGNGIGVATDTLGNIYISDTTNLLIRKVSTGLASPSIATGSPNTQSVQIHYIPGDSPASSNALAYTSTEWSLSTPTCTTNSDTTTDCLLTSTFTPAVPGARSTPLTVNSSLSNVAYLGLTGTGLGSGATLDPASRLNFGSNLQAAGLAVDTAGNVYVSDAISKRVLRFAASSLAQGSGAGSTTLATLVSPGAVAVDARGLVYAADTSTGLITQIPPAGATSTLPLTFTAPAGLAVDSLNNLYVSDSSTQAVYQVNPITGVSRTLVTGTLVSPAGLAIDPKGNLLIADPGAPAIYRFSLQSGARTTVTTTAVHPSAVLADAAGNLLVADTAAILATPASSNSASFTVASLAPSALAIDSAGNLYTGNGGGVLKLIRTQGYVQFAGSGAPPQSASLLESGNQALQLSSVGQTDTVDYGLTATSSTDCTLSGGLPSNVAVGGVCTLSASYTPTTSAATTDTATFNGNLSNAALSTPSSVQLLLSVATTAVTLQTSPTGLQVSVDGGAAQTAPFTAQLTTGSHTISVATTQAGGTGTQYLFSAWSDSGAASHTITVTSSPATFTASFTTQYALTTSASPSAGGSVTPAVTGAWYNAGTVVNLQATANSGYTYENWTGPVANIDAASTTVTMTAPATVVANFQAGAPAIQLTLGTKSGASNQRIWPVIVKNNGNATATAVMLTGLTLTQSGGTACSPVVRTTFPVNAGDVAPTASTTANLTIDFSSCTSGVFFTIKIPYTANSGAVSGFLSLAKQTP